MHKVHSLAQVECASCATYPLTLKSRTIWIQDFAVQMPQYIISMTESLTHQDIRDLGNGWWLFCEAPEWTLKIHVSYEGTSFQEMATSTVRDLWSPANHAVSPCEFRFSLQDFLQQFHSLPNRWGWEYEPLTEEIIHSSAHWQESCLVTSTLMPTHAYTEATVVAASLRCLVITYEISHVTANWSTKYVIQDDQYHIRLQDVEKSPRGDDRGIRPAVDVWKLADEAPLPDSVQQNREILPHMLQRTFQLTQRLLYRHRPQDWPTVFYVLCILLLVHDQLSYTMWTEATDEAAMKIKDALLGLCHAFYDITGNMQPLRSDLDLKRYAALVDENELVVEHYRRMHHFWLDNSECARRRRLRGATI